MAVDETCPVCLTAEIVCGKWTLLLVRDLSEGRSRFCELERSLAGISPRTLSLRLRALEEEGIVERHTFPEVPPRVEYALTEKGRALLPIIDDMRAYGEALARRGVRRARAARAAELLASVAAARGAGAASCQLRRAGAPRARGRTLPTMRSADSAPAGRRSREYVAGGRATACRPTSSPARRSHSSSASQRGRAREPALLLLPPADRRVHRPARGASSTRLPELRRRARRARGLRWARPLSRRASGAGRRAVTRARRPASTRAVRGCVERAAGRRVRRPDRLRAAPRAPRSRARAPGAAPTLASASRGHARSRRCTG